MIFGWAMFVLGVLAAHWASQLLGSRREAKRRKACGAEVRPMVRCWLESQLGLWFSTNDVVDELHKYVRHDHDLVFEAVIEELNDLTARGLVEEDRRRMLAFSALEYRIFKWASGPSDPRSVYAEEAEKRP